MSEYMGVGMVLLAIGQIASIALTLKSLFGAQRREISPSPLVVEAAAQHISAERFAEHIAANDHRASSIEAAMSKLVERMEAISRSDEARASSIHRRLNVISTNVATIAGCVSHMQGTPMQLQHEGAAP